MMQFDSQKKTRLLSSLLSGALLAALPAVSMNAQTVIQRDGNGDLNYDNNAVFGSSGLTLDVRRFATIPNTPGSGTFPRLNALTYAPGVDGLFVVDAGDFGAADTPAPIYHVSADGSAVTQLFNPSDVLNLPRNQFALDQQGGVRSLAFHPDFNNQGSAGYGKLYTSQVVARPNDISGLDYLGPSSGGSADSIVVEWNATFDGAGNLTGVDTSSAREVMRMASTRSGNVPGQHAIKQIAFNRHAAPGSADYGNLYILHGDGNNSSTGGSGQNLDDPFGKVLRVNPLQSGSDAYTVPGDNPFVNNGGALNEIYTYGHRNVHTIAFTQDSNGQTRVLVGEIGHGSVEQVNLLQAGGNYGWGPQNQGFYEGTFVRDGGFTRQGADPLPQDTDLSGFVFPVAQYGQNPQSGIPATLQSGGVAMAGGFGINNGSELDGYYFLTDFSVGENPTWAFAIDDAVDAVTSGNTDDLAPTDLLTVGILFDHDDDPLTPSIALDGSDGDGASLLDIVRNDIGDLESQNLTRTDIRFGQGAGGELYILNKRNGQVYLVSNSIAPVPEPGSLAILSSSVLLLLRRRR